MIILFSKKNNLFEGVNFVNYKKLLMLRTLFEKQIIN